jgi:hypothetical protein
MQGFQFCNWNEFNPNAFTSINWRASLVPAAAVIPAPIAYIKVVAVKTLVVETLIIIMGYLFEYVPILLTIILIYTMGNSFVFSEVLL